ncbi:MAG: squalene/phytoene synthase family protein [Bacteroidales bacterium]|jgi:phytoene synthase|nr:squalene/phytoene synthase family protein [Bacteroidales bacterium]MCB9028202.1 squalene/phytoene synthase family protein [Bacteroidales bacterium]HNT92658.1 squalene/phytoene synthase family protein [Bacteroidales bacterium]HOO65762.1 squalene/phytoene synthase family protein [Bacteroidales bacterium]HPE22009.1 squalene/phytoene synthase family protein [Bacteroidales bacterium]
MKMRDQFMAIFESINFEKIIDHPNILIAANFWDNERYCAARTCYRFMRSLDDLIDDHKAAHKGISETERECFRADIGQWMGMLEKGLNSAPFNNELGYTVEKFRIPRWSLEAFAESMLYDVTHDGFATLDDFIAYSAGASVAPASIFVHLAGLQERDGIFLDPPFDVRKTAEPCAMFSYLVHIMRDFRKDQLNNLSYFADDVMERNGLSRTAMGEMARGAALTDGFRAMMRRYLTLADHYRLMTVRIMDEICPMMEPRYRLSLEIIFELYMMVFERIDPEQGTFTAEELNPTPAETRERVRQVIIRH